jgi:hypothetical protein
MQLLFYLHIFRCWERFKEISCKEMFYYLLLCCTYSVVVPVVLLAAQH